MYSSSSVWPGLRLIAWHCEALGRQTALPLRIASPTSVNVALLPPAITPRKTINGCLASGNGCWRLRSSYGVSWAVSGGVPAGAVPKRTATWYTVCDFSFAAGFLVSGVGEVPPLDEPPLDAGVVLVAELDVEEVELEVVDTDVAVDPALAAFAPGSGAKG